MTPSFHRKIKDVATYRVLEYIKTRGETTLAEMRTLLEVPGRVNLVALLAEMETAGLIERQTEPTYGQAKPYTITPDGERRLEEARQTAHAPGSGPRQNWAGRERATGLQATIAEFLACQSEFRESSDERIRRVSDELARIALQVPTRER